MAVTKSDLVEPDFLELVKAEARGGDRGHELAGAPVVACSAMTRDGLDELLAALEARAGEDGASATTAGRACRSTARSRCRASGRS